jgi:hypothetical protein
MRYSKPGRIDLERRSEKWSDISLFVNGDTVLEGEIVFDDLTSSPWILRCFPQ